MADQKLNDKQKWLLDKMGVHPSAWVYGETLLRVCNFEAKVGQKMIDSLKKKGLFEVEVAPCGPLYRLTGKGRAARLALGTKVGKAHS